MRIHQLSESEALASLGSAAEGLSFAEARRRLEEFGPNRVEELRREHPFGCSGNSSTSSPSSIEAVAAMAAFLFVLQGSGWRYGESLGTQDPLYLRATTACLSAIIVMQIVNVFLCRSPDRSLSSTGLLGNPLILWGTILEIALVLLIDYTALGNLVFGTAPIEERVWRFMVPFAAAMLVLEEVRKRLARSSR